jgi:hypothetical protein
MRVSCDRPGCPRDRELPNHQARQLRQITGNRNGEITAVDLEGWVVFWNTPEGQWGVVCPDHRGLMPSIKPTGELARLDGPRRRRSERG